MIVTKGVDLKPEDVESLVGVKDLGFGRIHALTDNPRRVIVRLGSDKVLRRVLVRDIWFTDEESLYRELRTGSEFWPDSTDAAFIDALWPDGFTVGAEGK